MRTAKKSTPFSKKTELVLGVFVWLVKFFTNCACIASNEIPKCPLTRFSAACKTLKISTPEASKVSRHGEYFSAREQYPAHQNRRLRAGVRERRFAGHVVLLYAQI